MSTDSQRPNTVIFQNQEGDEFAVTAAGGNPLRATVSVNDGNGNWVTLDGMKKDLKRCGDFVQKYRPEITALAKAGGFSFVAMGLAVENYGAPETGQAMQKFGAYVNNATALSDVAHFLHSAIRIYQEDGLTRLAVWDMGKVVFQAGGLGAGFASIALKDDAVTQITNSITAAAAAAATGKTGLEEKKANRDNAQVRVPGAYVDPDHLTVRLGHSIPLQPGSSHTVSRTPSSAVATLADSSIANSSFEPAPGGVLRRTTFSSALGPTPEASETPTNPIQSAYNPGRRDSPTNVPRGGESATGGRPVPSQNSSAANTTRRAKSPTR
ncbi:hypothetical protein AB0E08_46625 [Streptomyces sp. NPDC048281]|uniref:hypothetical protein n=1 Tax=Streptomyces sp. NPDC048281 TaxID=3154715 RepID=UPI00341CC41B